MCEKSVLVNDDDAYSNTNKNAVGVAAVVLFWLVFVLFLGCFK